MHNVSDAALPPERLLIEAIALRRLVTVEYNGATMRLAPHRMFRRHGDLYLSAFNPDKNWRSEEDRRLGHFKLAGLGNLAVSEDSFEPLPDLDPALPREDDELVFAL